MLLAAVAAAGLLSLWRALVALHRARLIEDTPKSRVRSASQGYVELEGIATGRGTTHTAPLSGLPCLWWRYRIERFQGGHRQARWRTLEEVQSELPFYLDDGTGVARIDPRGAEVSCRAQQVWYGSEPLPPTARLARPRRGLARLWPRLERGRYRYTEWRLMEGEPLYVLGHFVTEDGERTLAIDQLAARLLRRWKTDQPTLLARFDRNRDGRIDAAEWEEARAAARRAARRARLGAAGPHVPEHRVRKPPHDLPYLIGDRPQVALAGAYRRRAALYAAGFLAACALAGWLLSETLATS